MAIGSCLVISCSCEREATSFECFAETLGLNGLDEDGVKSAIGQLLPNDAVPSQEETKLSYSLDGSEGSGLWGWRLIYCILTWYACDGRVKSCIRDGDGRAVPRGLDCFHTKAVHDQRRLIALSNLSASTATSHSYPQYT